MVNHLPRAILSIPAFLAKVDFETLEPTDDGLDVFELESSPSPNTTTTVTIRGSSPVALAQGLGWYLKYHCQAFVGAWDNRRVHGQPTGRQLDSIDVDNLPRVTPAQRVRSSVRWRYCECAHARRGLAAGWGAMPCIGWKI